MIRTDFHVHSTYCDGKQSPEEIVQAALERGMTAIGFSGHSHVTIDDCCMTPEGTEAYKKEIARLKERYADRIRIYCGVEQDYCGDLTTEGFDYAIGSVHYLPGNSGYTAIDESRETLLQLAEDDYGGDLIAVAEKYFEMVATLPERFPFTIVGHFDLITKYNEGDALFSTDDTRYVAAWKKAADALISNGKIFEINTGAISRGYRSTPYPSWEMIRYIAQHGGTFLMNSDSHEAKTLQYDFEHWEKELNEAGIRLQPGLFEE